jgi:hypothetical protein
VTRRRALALAAGVVLLAGAGICGGWAVLTAWGIDRTSRFPHVSADDRRMIAAATRTTFPPSTEFLFFHLEGFQDRLLLAKVRLTRGDLLRLIADGPFGDAVFTTRRNEMAHFADPLHPEFDCAAPTSFRSAETEVEVARHVFMLIDDGGGEWATVYFVHMER